LHLVRCISQWGKNKELPLKLKMKNEKVKTEAAPFRNILNAFGGKK
jgi:hypothetical protein